MAERRLTPLHVARRLRYRLYERLHPDEPWIAQPAVAFLHKALDRRAPALEWGSGRSTQWFSPRVASLISVEFDPKWYGVVRSQVRALANVDLRYVPLDHDPSVPTTPNMRPYPKYVSVVDDIADASLGFVLVDGHYRQMCVLAVLPKIKSGGLLTVDNTDWLPSDEWGVPADWPVVHQSRNVMTQTTVWRKPSG